jgi:hypothetical protein
LKIIIKTSTHPQEQDGQRQKTDNRTGNIGNRGREQNRHRPEKQDRTGATKQAKRRRGNIGNRGREQARQYRKHWKRRAKTLQKQDRILAKTHAKHKTGNIENRGREQGRNRTGQEQRNRQQDRKH